MANIQNPSFEIFDYNPEDYLNTKYRHLKTILLDNVIIPIDPKVSLPTRKKSRSCPSQPAPVPPPPPPAHPVGPTPPPPTTPAPAPAPAATVAAVRQAEASPETPPPPSSWEACPSSVVLINRHSETARKATFRISMG
ncbi:neural Wiskott-Aldrich syndrome protein-like [Sitophilus oryzae]|uniref:Neural Wiskott-Aldrich syndrome protein-like n=1 Tax=Sitophilus oryzae TaxID=7048 RepID=A0A6J2YSU5_SITOR|nr:neural Wiskott-Aldrich syndrome protein-like [Sitophilus oryzae]